MSRNVTSKATNSKYTSSTRGTQPTKPEPKSRPTTKTTTGGTTASRSTAATKVKTDLKRDEEKKVQSNRPSKAIEKSPTTKPIATNSIARAQPKLSQTTRVRVDPKTSRTEPLRAKRDAVSLSKIKDLQMPSKPNLVKDTYHSVTVASPPPIRRKQSSAEFQSLPPQAVADTDMTDAIPHNQARRSTITLDPDEVVVLKKEKNDAAAKADDYFGSTVKKKAEAVAERHVATKDPVAFEVKFEDNKNRTQSRKANDKNDPDDECVCSDEYEDDFESYESDFETDSSSAEAMEGSDDSSSEANRSRGNMHADQISDDDLRTSDEEEAEENDLKERNASEEKARNEREDEDEDSEETQPPITVIHRKDRETERKLDSGSYDLKSANYNNRLVQSDSLDTTTNNSERLDSGLGRTSDGVSTTTYWSREDPIPETIFPVTKENQRGKELMKKVKLDEITFHLFALKPMDAEHYAKVYANLSTDQLSLDAADSEYVELDNQGREQHSRLLWSQPPAHFQMNSVDLSSHTTANSLSVGEEEVPQPSDDEDKSNAIRVAFKVLKKLSMDNKSKRENRQRKNVSVDVDKLNRFLNAVKVSVFEVLDLNSRSSEDVELHRSSFSNGFRLLNANFLNAMKVVKIFSKVKFNFILTVHESSEDIYRNEFKNLIVVWSTSDLANPIRLLSSWSQVSKIDICTESRDIIVSGLKDGGIAMWDLRETYSYCSKLDGYLTHFAASQSIVPILGGGGFQSGLKNDQNRSSELGSVIDVKSFKTETGAYALKAYKPKQFVSLNDTGILTIWSLVETASPDMTSETLEKKSSKQLNVIQNEFSSPWARVKLVQSAICDLRSYLAMRTLKAQSKFEQTVYYFENDIFDDKTLRELQQSDRGRKTEDELQSIRFTSLDTSSNMIYAATNRNYILLCSKTLRAERFRKIYINDSAFMFPTAIRLHPCEEFLIVGLSNGSVVAINCNQNKPSPMELSDAETNNNTVEEQSNSELIDANEAKKIQSSCAIQNMILNERKMLEEMEQSDSYFASTDEAIRPRTAIPEFEVRDDGRLLNAGQQFDLYDQQILLNGSVLRKHLVECLEISLDGRKLYCLSDGDVKIYDFLMGGELKSSQNESIRGIGLVKSDADVEHDLVALKSDNIVEIHKPKN